MDDPPLEPLEIEYLGSGPEESERWDAYVAAHPRATIYHYAAWRPVFQRAFGYRSWFLAARAGQRIVGCLPLYLVDTPLRRRLVSVPFRDRGGALWDSTRALGLLVKEAERLRRAVRASFVELKSLDSYPRETVDQMGLREDRYYLRSMVPLPYADGEEMLRAFNCKHRSTVRQSCAGGLSFAEESEVSHPLADWYDLHLRTQQRLGIPAFSRGFFEAMEEALRPAGRMKIFFVRKDDRPIAASINFLDRKMGVYAYSASDSACQHLRPNDFMIFRVLEWLIRHGYQAYDMGSDSPAQEGLLHFKRKWLAAQASVPVYSLGNADRSVSDSTAPRYKAARRLFRALPRQVAGAVGRLVVRHFG
jgi:CelD/BcsL family acetyltransferase involved in cellulose biosynthesis